MSIFTRFGLWLTPARRRALYGFVAAIGALLTTFGIVSNGELEVYLNAFGSFLTILGLLFARSNVDTSVPSGMPEDAQELEKG